MIKKKDKMVIASLLIAGLMLGSIIMIDTYSDEIEGNDRIIGSGQLGGVDWLMDDWNEITMWPSENPAPGYESGVMAPAEHWWWGKAIFPVNPTNIIPFGLTIREGVVNVPEEMFMNACGRGAIYDMGLGIPFDLPNSLITIGDNAFLGCRIPELTIPMNVAEIGDKAFAYNRIHSISVMPKIPPILGKEVFAYNDDYIEIKVPAESLEAYKTAPGWSDYANMMVPTEFDYPTSGTIMNIDWKIQGDTLTLSKNPIANDSTMNAGGIIWNSMRMYDIKNVIIGDGITNVPAGMFRGSNIESVVIGESVETIEMNAFRECEKLYDVVVGGAVKSIGPAAFRDCTSLETIVLGESVEIVYSMAFQGVPLKSLYMPQGIAIVDTLFSKSFDIRAWYDLDGKQLIGGQIGGHIFEIDDSVAKAVTAGDSEIPAQDVFKSPLKTIRLYCNALVEDLKFIWEERFAPQMKLIRL